MPNLKKEGVRMPGVQKGKAFGEQRYHGEFYQSAAWRNFRKWYESTHAKVCRECGRPAKYLDHIKPISQGGEALSEDNVQWLCVYHNSIKTNRDRQWMQSGAHDDKAG